MTQEREDALIANAVRAKRDAEIKLAKLHAEAKALGRDLAEAGNMLSGNVGRLWFRSQVNGEALPDRAVIRDDIDGVRIASLVSECREAETALAETEQALRALGF